MEASKQTPVLFTKKEECCGCGACQAVCSAQAIIMKTDELAFKYPQIISDICKCCNLCIKVCPLKQ